MLTVGDRVLDREGTPVEVKWVCPHRLRVEDLVELTTPTAKLLVTQSHRIMKMSGRGEEEVLASDVEDGDWILVGKNPEEVRVQFHVRETSTIEIGFENDASVEAWFISDGIVTKGQAVDESFISALQCKEEEEEEDLGEPQDEQAHHAEQMQGSQRGQSRSHRSRQRKAAWFQNLPSSPRTHLED